MKGDSINANFVNKCCASTFEGKSNVNIQLWVIHPDETYI